MRLLLAVSLLVLLEAHSTPIQDKIKRILDFMQTVRGNGALAISTPTGLYPVNEINEQNIPQIFGFHEGLRRELEQLKNEARSKGKTVIPDQFSADNDLNLVRRESKLPPVLSSHPSPPRTIPNFARGRLPPHAPPVHLSGYHAANLPASNQFSFGGFFNPDFDSPASIGAGDVRQKAAIGFNAANSHGLVLPPSSNIHVEPAPEFGDDIDTGSLLRPRGT